MSVANGPGQMALQVTPLPAHSSPQTRVSPSTPAFDDAYGVRPGRPMTDMNRCQVNDPSPPLLEHAGREGLRAQERTLQVRVDDAVPVGFGQLIERAADVGAGVIDQDVDVAARRRHFRVQPLDVCSRSSRRRQRRERCVRWPRRFLSPPPGNSRAMRPVSAMSAPASASAVAMVLPNPRAPPVTSAVLPSRLESIQYRHGGSNRIG